MNKNKYFHVHMHVKKSHIGYELAWTWVYKAESIITLQANFVRFS
jgi:hypothetical protein